MQLQTQGSNAVLQKKSFKITTCILGLLMIMIPLAVAIFMTKPEILQVLLASKTDVLKGIVIGISILPVMLFVGIKGGKEWYKKWWAWLAVVVTLGALITFMLMAEPSMGGTNGMDREMEMGPRSKGTTMYMG